MFLDHNYNMVHPFTKRDYVDHGAVPYEPWRVKDDEPLDLDIVPDPVEPRITRSQAPVYYNEDCEKSFGRDTAECSCYHCCSKKCYYG